MHLSRFSFWFLRTHTSDFLFYLICSLERQLFCERYVWIFLTFSVSFCAPTACRVLDSHLFPLHSQRHLWAFPCLSSLWAVGCKSQRRSLELCGPAFPRTSPGDTNFERWSLPKGSNGQTHKSAMNREKSCHKKQSPIPLILIQSLPNILSYSPSFS